MREPKRPAEGLFRDPAPDLRIGDVERDAVLASLGENAALGRLRPDEHAERVSAALTARTGSELSALTADLPDLPAEVARSRGRERRRRQAIAGAMIAPWLLVCTGLWVLWLLLGASDSPWPVWPTVFWGVPTVLGAIGVLRTAPGDPAVSSRAGTVQV